MNKKFANIEKYVDFFHDGGLIDIQYSGTDVQILMYSSEINKKSISDEIILSDEQRIKGILHLSKVKYIHVNGKELLEKTIPHVNGGDIVHFRLQKTTVTLSIDWMSSSIPRTHIFSNLEIQAENTWWENIPNLPDPFW